MALELDKHASFAAIPGVMKVRQIITEDPSTWDVAWQQHVTPWDGGKTQVALKELVESGDVDFPRGKEKTALVPGCGSGYEAVYLATELGVTTTGVDISPTAIHVANEKLAESAPPDAPVRFEVGDFFNTEETYDLVFDYSFFVALPPRMRADWARQMRTVLKPGGLLVCLVFPILEEDSGIGPPYFVRPEHYEELLGKGSELLGKGSGEMEEKIGEKEKHGEQESWEEENELSMRSWEKESWEKVYDEIPKSSLEGPRKGKERMVVWRRV